MKNISDYILFNHLETSISISSYDTDTDEGLYDDESEWNYIVAHAENGELLRQKASDQLINPLYAW